MANLKVNEEGGEREKKCSWMKKIQWRNALSWNNGKWKYNGLLDRQHTAMNRKKDKQPAASTYRNKHRWQSNMSLKLTYRNEYKNLFNIQWCSRRPCLCYAHAFFLIGKSVLDSPMNPVYALTLAVAIAIALVDSSSCTYFHFIHLFTQVFRPRSLFFFLHLPTISQLDALFFMVLFFSPFTVYVCRSFFWLVLQSHIY